MPLPIACTHCHSLVASKRINSSSSTELACIHCTQVLPLAPLAYPTRRKAFVKAPAGIQVQRNINHLKIILPWRNNLRLPTPFSQRPWRYLLLYPLLPYRFNRLTIEVNAQYIHIRQGPFPNFIAFGQKQFLVADIQQLYIRKSKIKKKDTPAKDKRSYALCAVLKNRKNIVLSDYLSSPVEALFLEQEIEQFLKIKDEIVNGEMEW